MRAFLHHFLYELRAGLRDRSQLFMNWLFPLLVYLLMAILMGGINPGFKSQMIPAMSLFAMMSSALLSLPIEWIHKREAGVLRSFKIHRVPALSILLAPTLANLIHMVGVSLVICWSGAGIFGATLPMHWTAYLGAWLLSALATCGIGMAVGTLMPNPRAGMLVSQLFYLPAMMLSGLMFPKAMLPPSLALVARFLPASWSMDAMLQALDANANPGSMLRPMAVLALTFIVGLVVSLVLFEWDSQSSRGPLRKLLGLAILVPAALAALL